MKVSLKQLVKAAEDMNKVMGLKPEIETEDVAQKDLAAKIKAEADEEVVAKDKLAESTWEVLRELGAAKDVVKEHFATAPADAEEEVEETEDEESEEEEVEETEDEEEESEEEEEEEKPAKKGKKVSKKEESEDEDDEETEEESDEDEEDDVADKKASKKEVKKAVKKEVVEKKVSKKADKADKKPGVIASILSLIQAGPISTEKLLAKLVKAFPDREEKSMLSTIKVQLPNRLAQAKKVKIVKTEKGLWKIG